MVQIMRLNKDSEQSIKQIKRRWIPMIAIVYQVHVLIMSYHY